MGRLKIGTGKCATVAAPSKMQGVENAGPSSYGQPTHTYLSLSQSTMHVKRSIIKEIHEKRAFN